MMDVLNKFKSTVSSTVFSTVSTIRDVLPGNPVNRDYEIGEHIASAGPGLLWKVFSGVKKSTRQAAAIFVLEKRSLEARYPGSDRRLERDRLLEQLKKSISQLTRLRHPQILTVQHPLEESRDCLAFATEPVFASLANILGRHDNMPTPVPHQVRDYKMFDVEIKYGLLQLCEGLLFLHDGVKLLHRNLSPDSIILNEAGAWKIFGFDFALSNLSGTNEVAKWKTPSIIESCDELMPDFDFLSPDYAVEDDDILNPAADMFTLGMLAFTLYNSKPLFTNSGSWSTFRRNCTELKTLRESNLQLIPNELKETLKLLLNSTPNLRPTAAQCTKVTYFDDIGVKTLANLDSQFQWDNLQKSQFYKGLPQVLPRLPHRVAVHRVVPCLAKEFINPHMIPFVLPSVLAIAQEATNEDFVSHILPFLKSVMKITDPVQVLLIFMQRMEMLLSKTPPSDIKSDVLPMIYRALESDTSQIQELCLSIIPGFAGLLDYQQTKTALLPRIKKLVLTTKLLSVRVNGLICIGKLLPHLDKWLVMDEILPMIQQVPSREPAVIMATIGILKLTLSNANLCMTKEVLATKVVPYLFPLSIENGLSVAQYAAIMALIRDLMDRVEEEHRAKLVQLSSIQNEQRSALQISMSETNQMKPGQLIAASSSSGPQSEFDEMFSGLGLASYVTKPDTGAIATSMLSGGGHPPNNSGVSSSQAGNRNSSLTLDDKQRMLRESEVASKMAIQPHSQLQPINSSNMGSKTSKTSKDLTSSLMESNLNQMKHSATFNPNSQQLPVFNQSQQWRPQVQQTQQWNQMPQFNQPQMPQLNQLNQPPRPDLSAFDSLLPSKTNQTRMTMNSLQMGSNNSGMMNFGGATTSRQIQQNINPVVKSLTASDISDLLG